MKKLINFAVFCVILSGAVQGQEKDTLWRMKAIFGTNGTQSSFVNWNAGGRNNISLLGYINGSANFEKGKFNWDNSLSLALGGLQYIGVGSSSESMQKTDDRIEIASSFGYNVFDHCFATLGGSFRTQALDGFTYPNDSVRVSTFMAPGYVNVGLGLEYKPSKHFSANLSPLSAKMTFVNDLVLSNAGAFGVDPGQRFRGEFGANFKMKYNKDIVKNINLVTSLELFSNYLKKPENIDVNADVLFTFKVNSWFNASLNWTLIYDDDIDIRDAQGNVGPRTQFKSVLGLGISYTLKNFEK